MAKKSFDRGETVEIQADTGFNAPWEPAVYVEPVHDMRGWHYVQRNGCFAPSLVPARRIRKQRSV